MKRSGPIKRKTPLKRGSVKLKRSPMKKVSAKRKVLNAEYAKLRLKFLKENPKCFLCWLPATEIHHKAGRHKFLLRVDTWVGLCSGCHRLVHDKPEWAKANGLILDAGQRRLL